MSRTKYTMINFGTSIINYLLLIILKLIIRSIIINKLGTQYLGIEGLFTNILSILGLAELGMGSAIIFNLYKPISEGDLGRIRALMFFYKKAYRIIGFIIGLLGLSLIPLLPYLIKDDLSFVNVNLIFIFYLLQSVSSYLFFAYKSSLLRAHQKEYIITIIGSLVSLATNVIQIICLFMFNSFEFYVLIIVFANIIQNFLIAKYSDKIYPWSNKGDNQKLSREELNGIYKNCYAIFLYKINGIVVKVTDNLVLAKFLGLSVIGVYSNYLLIYGAFQNIFMKLFNSMAASLGDLHAQGNIEHEEKIFKVINFFSIWSCGLISIGFFCLINDLISLMFGHQYLLSPGTVFLMSIEIYMYGIMKTSDIFRTSMGLFQQAKYRPLVGSVINLSLSLLLVKPLGISGVILGTIISNLLTYIWVDPYIIYKKAFNSTPKKYYINNLCYFLITVSVGTMTFIIISSFNISGLIIFFMKSIICFIVVNMMFFIFYHKRSEYVYLKNILYKTVLKRK